MVNVGKWGNTEGLFGGFAPNPEDYHIRRLLVKKSEVTTLTEGSRDEWEMVDRVIDKVKCKVELSDDLYVDGAGDAHWIPNTDEILKIDGIKISVVDSNGMENSVIAPELNAIKILPPRDPSFNLPEASASVKSNIHTNKGSGLVFYAVPEQGDAYELSFFRCL